MSQYLGLNCRVYCGDNLYEGKLTLLTSEFIILTADMCAFQIWLDTIDKVETFLFC